MNKPEMKDPKIKIVLTGGGTAGHVMPNLALVSELRASNFDIVYVGSRGVERELVRQAGLEFRQITCGKLRRYLSVENFIDVFKVAIGIFQAFFVLLSIKPKVVFSKGGFVAVPVCVAARMLNIPIVSHESDFTPGLANRIVGKFAYRILYTFEETLNYLPINKSINVFTPIRPELFLGDRARGLKFCGFTKDLPILLVMGGSQGAQRINDSLLEILPDLVKKFQIVHLTGKGKGITFTHPHYRGFEFIGSELSDVFAAVDLAVCRAGANSIFELLSLNIPMLLIPLEIGSRGDQVLNAKSFEKKGWATVLSEMNLTAQALQDAIRNLSVQSNAIKASQSQIGGNTRNSKLIDVLMQAVLSKNQL